MLENFEAALAEGDGSAPGLWRAPGGPSSAIDVEIVLASDVGSCFSAATPGGRKSRRQAPCLGCSRERLTICVVTREPIEWALPQGRGAWCKDCFRIWRSLHEGDLSLQLFGLSLQSGAEAKKSHDIQFLSLLSLRREQHEAQQ